MYQLTRHDFARVLEFIDHLYEPRDRTNFIWHVLCASTKLVSAPFTTYVTAVPTTCTIDSLANPIEYSSPSINEAASRFFDQHPTVLLHRKGATERLVHWNEEEGSAAYRRSACYNEFFRPAGLFDSCSLVFQLDSRTIESFAFVYESQICERDVRLLESVSKHLLQAYRNSVRLSVGPSELSDLTYALEESNQGIVLADLSGKIKLETAIARKLIERYFGKTSSRCLPQALLEWVASTRVLLRTSTDLPQPQAPLIREGETRRLVVRVFLKPDRNLLLLEEQQTSIEPDALAELGTTARQSEVLAYVALGKTNPEIGMILGMSPRTVSKHVEHILELLGVETRTAAACVALEHLNRLR